MRALARDEQAPARLALGDDRSPLALLTRLFLLGDPVEGAVLDPVLPLAAAAPLLQPDGDMVRSGYDLSPYADETHDWYVVSDLTDPAGRPLRRDHVLGVGGASGTLAQLTVRRPVERALDVATGCGVQSLHLATHARHVTATDAVPRALTLAATTAALSGTRFELLAGDLTAPVADRRFDLVVCNPPFVVGPAARYDYRDGGLEADEMSRRAVTGCAGVLADGGVAQLLVNWLHVAGEDWRDRVARWVAGLGVDAWLLERDVSEPGEYVSTWLADAGEPRDSAVATRWLEWFDGNRIEAVGLGWVVLRRGEPPHRVAVESHPAPVDQPLGAEIAGWLDRTGWLRSASDATLLGTRFSRAPELRLDTAARPGDAGWERVAAALSLDRGFRWSLPTDEATAALVAGCDGTRPLSTVVAVLAPATGAAVADVTAAACRTVRDLVEREDQPGFVSQLSLFGATARDPALPDLEGLLAGNGQAVRRAHLARISVVVDERWRAEVIARELADRFGLNADLAPAETGVSVGTPWLAGLLPIADAWANGALKRPPAGWALDGPRLRWWCLAAGSAAPGMYTLALGASDEHAWLAVGSALAGVGVPGVLVGPRADGPAYRIVGRRRLSRLVELVGDPPSGAPERAWPTVS